MSCGRMRALSEMIFAAKKEVKSLGQEIQNSIWSAIKKAFRYLLTNSL